MRIGTFLLGGIAGAAAVIYLNRNAQSMMFSAFNSPNTSWKNSSQQQGKTANQESAQYQTGNANLSTPEQKSALTH